MSIASLIKHFQAHADPRVAEEMSAYMRHQFSFLGIRAPLRARLSQSYLDAHGEPDDLASFARACHQAPHRELQYFVQDWLKPRVHTLGPEHLPLLEELIQTQPWWDTVDVLAPSLAGVILKQNRAFWSDYPERWLRHESLWLRRAAIIFQLKYKAQTDDELLFRACLDRAHERAFFIQKAMGWALRERSKTNPDAIVDFVTRSPLPALTRREALKWLKTNSKRGQDELR